MGGGSVEEGRVLEREERILGVEGYGVTGRGVRVQLREEQRVEANGVGRGQGVVVVEVGGGGGDGGRSAERGSGVRGALGRRRRRVHEDRLAAEPEVVSPAP